MSKVVDERVVEMRFDNSNFEKNIQGTLSTLDKFKQKLHLDGAAKGLESVSKAAKNVDMSNLGKGLETVQAKFSALEVMGVTALANLTNSAINAGKRIAASLTIEPIKTGFNEYELKMGSVQTIMASTGESLETVNKYLEELNKYSDQTIYSFADMTQNIGKFTNAGVKLEDAVLAIKGISNEAAVSGANANEASRAMYNFAQALSAGYVKLIDWKSIENANMATVEFKNQLIESAVAAGTLTETTDGLYKTLGGTVISATKNFNDSLKDEWMTTEVLVGTLRKYADENTEIGKKASQAATEVKTFSQMLDTLKESAQSGWAKTWEIMFGDFYEGKELWTSLNNAIGAVIDKMSEFRNKVLESAFGRSFTNLSNKIKGALDPVTKTADKISDVVDAVKDYTKVVDQIIAGDWGNGEKRWNDLATAGYDWAHAQNLVNEKLGDSTRHATKLTEAQKELTDAQKKASKTSSTLTDAEAKRLAGLVEMSDEQLKALGYTEEQIDALRELKKEAEKTGYSVEEFVKNIDKINGRTLFLDSFKNIGNSLMTIFGSIKDAWVEVFEITPEGVAQSLYDLIAGFHKLTSHLLISDETADNMKRTFKGLFAIIDIVTTLVAGPAKIAFKVLSKILGLFDMDIWALTAKIGDAIVAFRDWIDSLVDFEKIFDKIEPALSKGLDAIKEWASGIKEKFGTVASNAIDGLVNGLGKGASAVWDAIVDIGKTIINGIKKILGIHSPSTVMEEIGDNTIQGYTNGLSNGIKDITDVIINIFRTLGAFFPKLAIFNQIAWVIATMKSAGGEITSNFGEGISNGISNVTDAIKKVFTSIKNAFGDFDWSKLSAGLWVVSAFIPKFAILNIGAAIASLMSVVGGNATDGLKEGISSGASSVFDSIGNLINKLVEFVKNLLGIHSPSKVFMGIGKFLIAGLILGIVGSKTGLFDAIKKVIGPVIDWVKEKFSAFKEWLSNTDFPEIKMENIVGVGMLVGLALFAKKLLDIATDLGKGIKAFGDGVETFSNVAKKLTGGMDNLKKKGKFESIANNALKLSAAIAILAGSVYVLAQLDTGKLWSSIGAIAVLAGIVIALGAIISKIDLKGQEFGKFSLMLVAMSTSLWIMASAIKKLEFLNKDNIGYVLGGTAAMILGLTAILAVLGALVKGKTAANIDKAGVTIFKIAAALTIMTFVMKQLAKLDENTLIKGGISIVAFGVIITGLIAATRLAGKNIDKAGKTILKIALAIGIMAIVVKMLGKMDNTSLIKGGVAITALAGIVVGLIAATKLAAGNKIQKVGGTIAAVAAAIMMLGVTAAILSMISPSGLVKGIVAVTALGGVIAGLIWVTKFAGKDIKGVASTLFAASLAIAIMGATAILLGMISIPGLIKGVTAVTILGGIIALMIVATKNAGDCHKNILMMAIAIGVMAAAVTVLSFIDPTKLAGATIALSIIMGMFALMTKAAGQAQKAMGTIIVMTLAVGALAGLIYLLSDLPVEQSIGSAIALGGLTLALSVALGALSIIGKFAKQALIGVVALTTLAVPLWVFIQLLKSMSDVENAIGITNALVHMLMGFTLVLGVLTVIGLGGPAAIIGVGSLLGLIVAIGGVVTTIGWLMEKFPALEKFMNGGIEVLKRLAQGMGEIISAFGVGLTSGLPEIGENLSAFMDNLSGFISGANSITDDLGKKITTLAGAIVLLTAADLIAGISSFLQNGSSFAQLGADLSAFMINAMPFITGIGIVNPESLTAVKALAEAILILTAADVLSGLTSWFTGGTSLADFGAELAAFGPHMAAYAKAVAGIDGAAVESSAKAAKSLAEMASSLPNSGGVMGWFSGENDMSTFGTQLVAFGKAIKDYSIAVTGLVIEPIMASVEAGKALAEMADVVPNLGGVVSWFTGDNDLATFGTQLVSFGNSLKSYSLVVTGIVLESIMNSVEAGKALAGLAESIPNLGGMVAWFTGENDFVTFGAQIVAFGSSLLAYSTVVTGLNIAAITMSVMAAQQLAKLAQALPSDGGFWSIFKDDKINFTEFGTQMISLGRAIQGYSKAVGKINAAAVSASISSARKLLSLINSMAGLDSSGVARFSEAIGKLGKASVDKFVKAFTSSTSKLNNIGGNLIKAVATGAKSATGNLTTVVNSAANTMNTAFASRQTLFRSIGVRLMTAFISGINVSKSNVSSTISKAVQNGVTAARNKYTNFYNAGSYCVSGFVQGIKDNKYKATNAGSSLGRAAYAAAKAAIDSNSPSKKFLELGMFADQGLANGLLKYAYLATRASAGLGRGIVTSMQEELGIHSPAKVVKDEVGKYVVEGLAEGIEKDMTAEEAAEQKAKNIVDAFKNEMSKHDTDMTTSDLEYQLWEVQNESASAAEKTAQKAASIYKRVASQTEKVALAQAEYQTTFETFGETSEKTQEAYNKWVQEQIDLNNETKSLLELRNQSIEDANNAAETSMTTSDLKYELWETNNPKATDAEKASKNMETILEKLPKQAEAVGLAQAKWDAAKERYGESSTEAAEMYNEYLQSQIDMGSLINSISDSYDEAIGTQRNAQTAYFNLMRQNQANMLKDGLTQDQIEAWARKESGYDPDLMQKLMTANVDDATANAMSIVEATYLKYAGMTFETLTGNAEAYGQAYGESIASGVGTGAGAAVQTLTAACTSASSTSQADWVELGKHFVIKFAEGVNSAVDTATQATITMISSAYQAAIEFINNPENVGGFVPTISPILDLSRIQNGVSQMNGMFATSTAALADINVRLTNDSITELSEIADEMRRANETNHSEIVNTIKTLRGDVADLAVAVSNMQIRMDTGALVGSISGPLDKNLGQKAGYKGRGN